MTKKNIYNAITESFDAIGYNESEYHVDISTGQGKIHITIREKKITLWPAILLLDILHEPDWRIQEINVLYTSLPWNHQVYTTFLNALHNVEYIYV